MASIRSLLGFAGGLLTQSPFSGTPEAIIRDHEPYSNSPSCPLDGPISCHNVTDAGNSCCFIYPGGQLLQTQSGMLARALDLWIVGLYMVYGPSPCLQFVFDLCI